MKFKVLFAIIGIAALSAVSFGQGGRGGMFRMPPGGMAANPTFLLQSDQVKTELKLSDDQKSKLDEINQGIRPRIGELMQSTGQDPDARRKAFEGFFKKIAEDINKVLTSDQQKRLLEIAIQQAGNQAAMVPDLQKTLGISDAQKAKLDDLQKRQETANQELGEKLQNGDIQMEDMMAIREKNQKVMNDEIGKVLTQAQKDKLAELAGKKIEITDMPAFGRRGGGGGGR